MPKIEKAFRLEVTPERFLEACSSEELIELDMLLTSPRYRERMNGEGRNWPKKKYQQLRIPD